MTPGKDKETLCPYSNRGSWEVSLLAEEVPPGLTLSINFARHRPLRLVAPLSCILPQHAAECLTSDKENLCLYVHPDIDKKRRDVAFLHHARPCCHARVLSSSSPL
ncbi:uncharacterized protein LOC119347971 [Triticum dicoccoides]|uniref:uncharacterized protein LOC119347971 n=1 Tax=Triticum dicoccoides TaxID=85692 RepID=UPI00188EB217|nr:uncharacterized protein LOC119347971 [Triticum dicoccoides]